MQVPLVLGRVISCKILSFFLLMCYNVYGDNMVKEFISKSKNETIEFAKKIADDFSVGDIILLKGDLGAGKTVFVKAVTDKFSTGKMDATSPTFTIVNTYETTPPIYHFDLYRINDSSELDAIGAEEYLYGDGICFVEWPERAMNYFYGNVKTIEIIKLGNNERLIRVEE